MGQKDRFKDFLNALISATLMRVISSKSNSPTGSITTQGRWQGAVVLLMFCGLRRISVCQTFFGKIPCRH